MRTTSSWARAGAGGLLLLGALLALGTVRVGADPVARGTGGTDPNAPRATWNEELSAWGWYIVHLSTINVVNGLNLTRDQLVRLRAFAAAVESSGATPPPARPACTPEVAAVRTTYDRLQHTLAAGAAPDAALRAEVLAARSLESRVLRAGLTPPRTGFAYAACARCHGDAAAAATGAGPGDGEYPAAPAPAMRREMGVAHAVGLYGRGGLAELARVAPQVDALLTPAQLAVFDSFSCCLIPPSELSDPVRVGQAAAPGWALDLLRKARAFPETAWPIARARVLDLLAGIAAVKQPGVTRANEAALRARLTAALERARGLGDVDFELAKEELCGELTAQSPAQDHRLKRAYFLLTPGSVALYDALLARRDAAPAPAPAPAGAPAAPPPSAPGAESPT
ncbi:MAG: hypothetical protein HZA54_09200 [Planctomycetes bacterium]|nr:hypothetical protein [Planctomycetota bacterium]